MNIRLLFRQAVLGVCLLLLPFPVCSHTNQSATDALDPEVQRFRAFLADDWKRLMLDYPEFATWVGYPGQNRRWTDESPAGYELRVKHLRESLSAIKQFHRDQVPPNEQLNYDLYLKNLQLFDEGLQYGGSPIGGGNIWIPVTQLDGVQQDPAALLAVMPHQSVQDYDDILARLAALPQVVNQAIARMKGGIAKGYSPPQITMRDVPTQVADLIPPDPMKSALLEPFQKFPPSIGETEQAKLLARAKEIYTNADVPAFSKLRGYLVSTYIPACRQSIAATDLPNGAAAYAYQVRLHTTTSLTPAQIHEIGL